MDKFEFDGCQDNASHGNAQCQQKYLVKKIVVCSSGFGKGPVVPVKSNVNARAYNDVLDKCMLST